MKVIDLLNKIANGEEVPKYVIYKNRIKKEYECMMVCKENIIYKLDQLEIKLNDEIYKYIENEEDKKIKYCNGYECFDGIDDYIEHLRDKIDDLIDEVNKLKENE